MLEPKVNRLLRKLMIFSLVGASLLAAGCVPKTYAARHLRAMHAVKPVIRAVENKKPFGKMTCKELIESVQTPEEAQEYLDEHYTYAKQSRGYTFRVNHTDKRCDCLGYSIAAAALLSDNGYPATLLVMAGPISREGHAVFLYRTEKGYGSLGSPYLSESSSLDPIYHSPDDIVRKLERRLSTVYTHYAIVDLDKTFPGKEWIWGNVNTELKLYAYFFRKVR